MERKRFQDLLHLTESERSALTNRLNDLAAGHDRSGSDKDRRQQRRWDFPRSDIPVVVGHIGGGLSQFLVSTRNLSALGLAFLHGGYIHTGSKCRIDLVDLQGKPQAIIGVVTGCRHLEGRHHEVSVKFDQRIDPEQFQQLPPGRSSEDQSSGAVSAGKAAGSSTAGDSSMNAALEQFIAKARAASVSLEKAMLDNDLTAVRNLCAQIKDSAPACGFDTVAAAAANVLATLDAAPALNHATEQLKTLRAMCQKVKVSDGDQSAGGGFPGSPRK